jgi:hypothetical protein
MVAECALMLVNELDLVGKAESGFPEVSGGVVTAASAFRSTLAKRLVKHAKMEIDFEPTGGYIAKEKKV